MILDTVSRLSRYAALNPLFLLVAEYLRRSDLNLMADGRYEISGEDAFLTLTRSSLRLSTEASLTYRSCFPARKVTAGEASLRARRRGEPIAPSATSCSMTTVPILS